MRIHSAQPDGISVQEEEQLNSLITIAVMGATGSGKTSFVNAGSGSNLRIGSNLGSCTTEVQLSNNFTLDGRRVLLIDTPGFDDTRRSDTDILKLIAAFLETTYGNGSTLAGVIYIHRISDKRFTGITKRNFGMFRELCGDETLKNVILVTNMWGEVSREVGEAREQELIGEFFKPVLDKGAQIARHHDTVESARDIIRRIMKNRPVALQIQRELVEERKNITETAAGQAARQELNEQIEHHKAELKAVQEEMLRAQKKRDEETRLELDEEMRKIQEEMKRMRMSLEGMAVGYDEEKKRTQEVMRQMQEQARQDREWAEQRRRTDELNERNEEKRRMEEAMRQMQEQARQERERATAEHRRLVGELEERNEERRRMEEAMRQMQEEVRQERERAHQGLMENMELNKLIRRHQADLKGLREEMLQALREKDEEMRRELEEEKRRMEEVMQAMGRM